MEILVDGSGAQQGGMYSSSPVQSHHGWSQVCCLSQALLFYSVLEDLFLPFLILPYVLQNFLICHMFINGDGHCHLKQKEETATFHMK